MEEFIDGFTTIISAMALLFLGYTLILSIAFLILWSLGLDTTILHNFGFYGEQLLTTIPQKK